MGALCSKGFPKEYEDVIAEARKKVEQKIGKSTAPVVVEINEADRPEAPVEVYEPPKPKPVAPPRKEDVLISNLLQRAKAGGEQAQIAAAMAAATEVDVSDLRSEASEVSNGVEQRLRKLLGKGPTSSSVMSPAGDEEQEEIQVTDRDEHLRKLQALLGGTGPTSSSSAPPPAAEEQLHTATIGSASRSPVNSGPSGPETLKAQGYSKEVMREAARLGLPLPSTEEEDETYDATDAYMDGLLGIPAGKKMPDTWEPQPDLADRPSLEGPGSGRPSLTNRPSLDPSQRPSLEGGRLTEGTGGSTANPYMAKALGGWASIDSNTGSVGGMQRVLPDIREAGAEVTSGAGAAKLSLQPSNATNAASTVSVFPASRDSFGAPVGSHLQQGQAAEPRGSFGYSKPTLRGATDLARDSFGASVGSSLQQGQAAEPYSKPTLRGATDLAGAQRNSFGGAAETQPRDSYARGTPASDRESFNTSKPPWQNSDPAKATAMPRESFGRPTLRERPGLMAAPQRESIKTYPRESFGDPASSPYAKSDGMMLPPWRNPDEAALQQPQQQQQQQWQQQQQQRESYGVASAGRWGNDGGQGATQRNNFGGAAAMLDSFGRSAASAASPRESFGGVAARAPQEVEVSMRVADGDRPAPKRRAKG